MGYSLCVTASPKSPQPLLTDKKTLTLTAAKKIAQAAEDFAASHDLSVVIALVDDGANLLYLARMDGAPIGSVTVAEQKARTAAIFKCPTSDFEKGLAAGATSLLKLDILPYEGGTPIVTDGGIVGAIGVSGGTAAQDGQVSRAGAEWLGSALK